MNKYELNAIFKPEFDEESLKAELEKVQALLTRFGATVDKVDSWGKRRLAYEINDCNEGYYYFLTFTCDADVPAELESRLRIMESLIRYLIIRLED